MKKASSKKYDREVSMSEGPSSTPILQNDETLTGDAKLAGPGASTASAITVGDVVVRSDTQPRQGRRDSQRISSPSSSAVQHQSERSDHPNRERGIGETPSLSPARERTGPEGVSDRGMSSVEKDAAHVKMVAARFRALMERRERRLEEAMSDPQTRTDLEAMFPGIREGDYQTLLAGVRGMEEEDFQTLLAGARKRRREQGERGMENGREGRKSSKMSLPPSSTPPTPSRHRSPPPPPPPPGMSMHGWEPIGAGDRREHYYPAAPHQPAYAEHYYYDQPDAPFPHQTESGGRVAMMSGGDSGRVRATGTEGRRGEGGEGEGMEMVGEGSGRGLPPMWSRQNYQQWRSSSSRPGSRDTGGPLASPTAAIRTEGIGGGVGVGGGVGNDPREIYYHHADRGARDGDERGRETLPAAAPAPLRVPYDERVSPPMGRPSAVDPTSASGGGSGVVHLSYARSPSRNRDALVPGGMNPASANRHPATLPNRDLPPRYFGTNATIDLALCEAVDKIVQHRDQRGGSRGASPSIACRPQSVAVVAKAPGTERDGYREREVGVEESRAPSLDAKRVAMRLCELVERFGGHLDEVMADPRARVELESIFPGLEEKDFRAMLRGCVERPQPPPLYRKPAEQAHHDGDRPYRLDPERLYQDRERPYHHRSEPEHPRYPPTRQHRRYPEMEYGYRDGRDRYFSPEGRTYREPRDPYPPQGGSYAEYSRGSGGVGDAFVPPKRECPEDLEPPYEAEQQEALYPKYLAMPRIRVEHGAVMGIGRGEGSRPSPALPPEGRTSGRSPEDDGDKARMATMAAHGNPSLASPHPPLYQPPPRHAEVDHPPAATSEHTSPLQPPLQPRRPDDVPTNHLPYGRDSPFLRDAIASQTDQLVGHGPRRSALGTPRSDASPLPGGENDDGGSVLDGRRPASRSPSPDERISRPKSVPMVREVMPIDGGEKPFCEVVRDASGMTRLFIPENPPVVQRRPPSKGNKRETLSDIAHRIPVDVMRPYFNYPLRKAAEAMNISVTTLKRLCRRHGVKRWPHRQISGINRAMAHLEFQQDQAGRRNGGSRVNTQVSEQMQELLRRRRVMIEHAFESDDGGGRSQGGCRNSLDSDEEAVDNEAYDATDPIEPPPAEEQHPVEANEHRSNGDVHGGAPPCLADRVLSASTHVSNAGREPVRHPLQPATPSVSPSNRPESPSTLLHSRRHVASSTGGREEMTPPLTPPMKPRHQQQQRHHQQQQQHTGRHEQRRHSLREQREIRMEKDNEEAEQYHHLQQRQYDGDMRRSERLETQSTAAHRGEEEDIERRSGQGRGQGREESAGESREMVVEKRELRPRRGGREQEEAQSLKRKQRSSQEEHPSPKRSTPREHNTKAEHLKQTKSLRPGQKPPSPLTCGPRLPLRTRERGSPPEHADRGASRTPPGTIPDLPGFALPGSKKDASWGTAAAPTATAS